jgi:hypothetical protein
VTLRDIVAKLSSFPRHQEQESIPTIYVAEPWAPSSDALVEWGSLHGGLPAGAANRLLVRFIEVGAAVAILKTSYSDLADADRYDDLCVMLVDRVRALVRSRDPYGYKYVDV